MKYQDLIDACHQDWQEYTEHAFVQQLAQGTLAQLVFYITSSRIFFS